MTDKIIETVDKVSKTYFNENKKTIVVSITAFEAYDCLLDLILNITYFFKNYNTKILISLKSNCNINFNFEHVHIHTILPSDISLWGNISLFNQHYLAYEYCKKNNIKFDFFTFCTSNQLFFKTVTDTDIENALMTIKNKEKKIPVPDEEYEKYFDNFVKMNPKWVWHEKSLKDLYFTSYMKNNKYMYYSYGHEGLIFDIETCDVIMNEYEKNNFFDNCDFRNFAMEEIFPITFLLNNYKIHLDKNKSLCDRSFSYDGRIKTQSLFEIQKYNEQNARHVCSLKPIKRFFNDEYRMHIRNDIYNEIYGQ